MMSGRSEKPLMVVVVKIRGKARIAIMMSDRRNTMNIALNSK